MFFQWLLSQRERQDDIGRFSLVAFADRSYPSKTNRLIHVLRWCGKNEDLREAAKQAHREFRRAQGKAARAARRATYDGIDDGRHTA